MKNTPSTRHAYRPDIDGLRAVAVLVVILFHYFPKIFRAGFIGVDIFFVISGYLISSIIFSQLHKNKFSFLEFYRKRILRIFPSLCLSLTFALVFGWFVLLSTEFELLGKHLAAAATFTSNFALWRESGYFDRLSDLKPLLHLWSLAIEEQYYIFFPLLVWACFKIRLKFSILILLLLVSSFFLNIYFIQDRVFDFYCPLMRFWELMAGAMIASLMSIKKIEKSKVLANGFSILGFALLIFGLYTINEVTLFPGWYALIPVIGACALIVSGQEAVFNKYLLSNPLMVWIGKISYPLYLWHWLILSLVKIIEGDTPNIHFRILFIFVSILFAWFSVRFLENPIRFGQKNPWKERGLIIWLAIIGASGLFIYWNKGVPSRDEHIQQVLFEGDTEHDYFHQFMADRFSLCIPVNLRESAPKYHGKYRCFQTKTDSQPTVAIIGDSHAENFFPGLAEKMTNTNLVYYFNTVWPILSEPLFDSIFKEVLSNPSIKTILYNAYWVDKTLPYKNVADTIKKLLEAKKTVYVFDDIPTYSFQPSRCMVRRRLRNGTTCERSRVDFEAKHGPIKEEILQLKKEFPEIRVVFSSEYFCNSSECSMVNGNNILYRDDNHLNIPGSRFFAEKFLKEFPELLK